VKTALSLTAAAILLCACWGGDDDNPPSTAAPAGVIDRFEVVSSVDAYVGAKKYLAAGP
jgi:hypothetical protein